MKTWICLASRLSIGLLMLAGACQPAVEPVDLPSDVLAFAKRKELQARKIKDDSGITVAPDIWRYFNAAKRGDYPAVERLFEKLKKRAGQYEGSKADPAVTSEIWQTVLETHLACEQFALNGPKYARAFGQGIIESIPSGSIYFGGTDAGRGLVTVLCRSQEAGDPFFTITQNALADNLYLKFLDGIYGKKIYIPKVEDSQKAFNDYLQDAHERMQAGKLKPGEDVKVVGERVQVSGQTAVMTINGLLAKVIFDKNPHREFFLEESFPLDWMYPHLAPHGLIMKIHREPLSRISAEQIAQDRKFWSDQLKPLVGDWLTPDTPLKEVCDFAATIFTRKDHSKFQGDAKFISNTNACSIFSKLRSSIAGIYMWRASQTSDKNEKAEMVDEADFAFRQAYALCPYSPEALFRYVNFLIEQSRSEAARHVAETSRQITPNIDKIEDLVNRLQKQHPQGEKK
jgi:hypothetical protein